MNFLAPRSDLMPLPPPPQVPQRRTTTVNNTGTNNNAAEDKTHLVFENVSDV